MIETNESAGTSVDPDDQAIPAIYWYIPLLIPIQLPSQPISSRHSIRQDNLNLRAASLEISLFPVTVTHLIRDEIDVSFQALNECLPEEFRVKGEDSQSLSELTQETVVIEAVACFHDGVAPNEEELSGIFDLVVERIREIQRAHYIATKVASPLVTREQLPSILAMRQVENLSALEESLPGKIGAYLVNPNTARRMTPTTAMDSDQLLAYRAIVSGGAGVFARFADLVREAQAAKDYYGNYRDAVLNSATASEVLLDTLLVHLQWEEKESPEDTADLFITNSSIAKRVKSLYSSRLKGNWDLDGSGVTATWYRDCMNLRNRIVHSGHQPDVDEAESAISAALGLQAFIATQLTKRGTLKKYPYTAYSLVGIPGLARRKLLTHDNRESFESYAQDIGWSLQLDRFHRAVMVQRELVDVQAPEPDPRECFLHIVFYPDGSEQWVLWHRESGRAASLVADQSLLQQDASMIDETRTMMSERAKALLEPIAVKFLDAATPSEFGDWKLEYHYLPLLSTLRQ